MPSYTHTSRLDLNELGFIEIRFDIYFLLLKPIFISGFHFTDHEVCIPAPYSPDVLFTWLFSKP